MTQALITTHTVNKVQSDSSSLSQNLTEHRQAVRSAIIAARPVMPDDESRRAKLRIAKKIWEQSIPVTGSIAETYLQQQGLACESGVMACMRFNSVVLHEPTREHFPALIAPVHDLEGEFVGIHKTYLTPDGMSKAHVNGDARRMLGECLGSYVQLCEASSFRLVITESIESAIAVQQSCPLFPVWSAMSPANMKSPVPPSIREVILCADGCSKNKDANAKLIRDAARQHLYRGVRVSLVPHLPTTNFGIIL